MAGMIDGMRADLLAQDQERCLGSGRPSPDWITSDESRPRYGGAEKQVLTSDRGKSVETNLTDDEAFEILVGIRRPSNFAQDLIVAYRKKGWSHNQRVWGHIIALGELNPEPKPAGEQVTNDIGGLLGVFKRAQSRLKFPKVRLAASDGTPVRFGIAGPRSKHVGTIGITDDGEYGFDQKWFGRIHLDGKFEKGRNLTPAVEQVIRDFASDPAGTAAAYGKKSGHCCFCNAELTDERSRFVGYGKICAGNWKLPWGEKE